MITTIDWGTDQAACLVVHSSMSNAVGRRGESVVIIATWINSQVPNFPQSFRERLLEVLQKAMVQNGLGGAQEWDAWMRLQKSLTERS